MDGMDGADGAGTGGPESTAVSRNRPGRAAQARAVQRSTSYRSPLRAEKGVAVDG
jgi:hypothetical protein